MKIDRHNYEEYFLLYIDDELTVHQKKQVELFVKENSDLEEELITLQRSRLIPDENVVFNEKHLLMKEENNSFITLNNYEEWLVLYADNELNNEEKIAVEKFAHDHPVVQDELALFQQTKLQPETIVFPNKQALYKPGTRKIVIMQWWKVAVAAVLVLVSGITLYSILTKSDSNPAVKTASRQAVPIKKQQPSTPLEPGKDAVQVAEDNRKKEEQVAVINPRSNKKAPGKQVAKNRQTAEPNNNVDLTDAQPIENVRATVTSDSPIGSEKIANPQIKDAVSVNDKKVDIFNTKTVTPDPHPTPYNPEVASNTENKRFRGFFRKATRFIERTANINPTDDDNRVLIGGMAINLK
ncbi:MAG TPA: hypothetical protein VFP87_04685 [Chitinophagaceae bacterium]|nr:hypothetical protein [Chitinophagaceae bacterium]